MGKRKERSVFWVVSTHVLTTGFVMPLLAGVIGAAVVFAHELRPIVGLLVQQGLLALGYIGGAYYSLSYIRKVAIVRRPMACVKPSIVAFVVLAVIGFGLSIAGLILGPSLQGFEGVLLVADVAVFYIVITFGLAIITRRGFAGLEKQKDS